MATRSEIARAATVSVGDGVDRLAAAGREVKTQVREKTQQAKQTVRRRSKKLKDEVEQRADRWTTVMGEELGKVSRALESAGDALDGKGEHRLAAILTGVAQEIERVGGYLEEENPKAMMRGLEETARRNPAAFLGTTFISGLLIARFLRSSEPEARAEKTRRETREWLRAEAARREEAER